MYIIVKKNMAKLGKDIDCFLREASLCKDSPKFHESHSNKGGSLQLSKQDSAVEQNNINTLDFVPAQAAQNGGTHYELETTQYGINPNN